MIFTYLKTAIRVVDRASHKQNGCYERERLEMLGISPPSGKGQGSCARWRIPHRTTPRPRTSRDWSGAIYEKCTVVGYGPETHMAYIHTYGRTSAPQNTHILPGLTCLGCCASCNGCPSVLSLLLGAVPSHTPPT